MGTKEEEEYQEYRLLLDVFDEYQGKLDKLEKTINALKDNPSLNALYGKGYLGRKEKEKKRIDIIIKALSYLRYDEK